MEQQLMAVLIIILIAFILGLIVGVSLARPQIH